MKAVILAAGFGTRLEQDLRADESGKYKHLIGIPKPLLPIGHCQLVTHWLQAIIVCPEVEDVYVVTNAANHDQFVQWSTEFPQVKLVCDNSTTNENRSGAIACMDLASLEIKQNCGQEHIIFIAGDTLFFDDFSLSAYIHKFQELQNEKASMLVYVNCADEDVQKYGILETDTYGLVTGFLEKPQPHETNSRKACPCFYFLNKSSMSQPATFLQEMKDAPLKCRDAPGNFIKWLYKREPVHAVEISGRYDVGGLQTYIACHQHFMEKNS